MKEAPDAGQHPLNTAPAETFTMQDGGEMAHVLWGQPDPVPDLLLVAVGPQPVQVAQVILAGQRRILAFRMQIPGIGVELGLHRIRLRISWRRRPLSTPRYAAPGPAGVATGG